MNDPAPSVPILSTDPSDRMLAACCHLSTLATFFPFANVALPLLIWAVNRDRYPLVNDQGKEALNFQITMMIGYAIVIPLCFVLIGIPLIIALGLAHVIFSIIASIKAYEGQAYRYPCTLRLIN